MSPPRPHRRNVLGQLLLLGAGGAAIWAARNHLLWPDPEVAFTGGAASSGWIDLPARGGLVDLPARIKGVWFRAVVDSGAQYSAIDAALAQRLKLPAATPIPMVAFGVSGQPSITRSVTLDLDVGDDRAMQITGLRAATLNLSPLSGLTAQPFSMLLGRDFLRAVAADIDFPRRRAAFFKPDAWTAPQGAVAAPVQMRNGALFAAVKVEDAPPVEVMVDTGATGALALSEEAAQAAGLFDGRDVQRTHSITLGGVSQDRIVRAERIGFAGQVFPDVPVQIYSPSLKAAIPGGLLGLGVLGRYRVGMDLGRGRLHLQGPAPGPAPARRRRR
ncbi:aspartyl protease family protein [Phenylobacterium deserti]|uniref:Peptidase aspartic n=1 Tax=Phenylobacterium deserti TaxID=1914756 RepID=A0A328AXV1_9CAUL|nr:aspartyl protease family protein [Phenylobacterium deserti]RAK57668.1 hypothetical protein DJ018_07000 [Phenylobacterium deserti]